MFGIDMLSNPMIGFVFQFAVALSLFSLLVWIVYVKWDDLDRPEWLERLYGYTKQFVEIPKWIVQVVIINSARFILTLQESMIETAKKMRSRPYQVFAAVFALVYIALKLAAEVKDPQILFGLAAVFTAASALMMYASKRLIDSRDKDHDHEVMIKMNRHGNGDEVPDLPPGPDLSPKKGSKKKSR